MVFVWLSESDQPIAPDNTHRKAKEGKAVCWEKNDNFSGTLINFSFTLNKGKTDRLPNGIKGQTKNPKCT